jgi:ABC-type arginine/histidine transport system permease subunit
MFQVSPGPIEEILAVLEYWDHIFSGFLMTMWLYGWAILIGFFL